jgi:hypothetical protein
MISLYCEAEVTLRTDHWDYITATYDADTKEMVLYVNGEYRGATNANDGCRNPIDEIGALFLGYGYTGRIDDVAIFNKVLSEDEVDVMYAADACL